MTAPDEPVTPPDSTPVTLTAVQSHPATGQSLEMAVNIGGSISPSGPRWREVLTSPKVRMVTGRKRSDGVTIASVVAPVLKGYDPSVPGTGDSPAYASTYAPLGMIADLHQTAFLPEGVGIVQQFPGAGGMSILDLTAGPCYDNLTFNISDEHRYWASKGVAYSVPTLSINQGEADVSRGRGWWDNNAQIWLDKTIAHIRSVIGQPAFTPRLYVQQTGGYMVKNDEHEVVLDQITFVRRNGGILVGSNYWEKIDNTDGRGVHQTLVAALTCGVRRAIARMEVDAGRDWNLLPPVSVPRVGNTVTVPISTRAGENLATVPGKYTDYGGDPANLGLEVVGGGSITSATVSGSNIEAQVAGAVTAIRYAKQRTGIDYRTLCDVNNHGYTTHRGNIKATDEWTVSVGGVQLTIDRPVPSFEVAVV